MSASRIKIFICANVLLIILLAVSGYQPFDRTTWVLEIFPILIALPILWATYRRFPLTNLLYIIIFFHAVVLMVGGAYTYARVPIGFQVQEWLDLSRNPYDKLGHFMQGFTPALVAREIFIRNSYVKPGKMLGFLIVCVSLAISAVYEIIEWFAAICLGQGADEFLGTQGDQWDTQSDMLFAMIGSFAVLFLLSRLHDGQIKKVVSAEIQNKQ